MGYRAYITGCAVIAPIVVALAYFANLEALGLIILAGIFCVILPLILCSGLLWLLYRRWPEARSCFSKSTIGLSMLVLIGITTFALGLVYDDYAVRQAKAYPARIAPFLEDYRQKHGAYPNTLEALPNLPAVPRFMRRYNDHDSYIGDGNTYSFQFRQSHSESPDWIYKSDVGAWKLVDE